MEAEALRRHDATRQHIEALEAARRHGNEEARARERAVARAVEAEAELEEQQHACRRAEEAAQPCLTTPPHLRAASQGGDNRSCAPHRAAREQPGGVPWPQEPASGRPQR